jgi:hypothetical protein
MFSSLKPRIQKYLYSEETNNILNLLTLQIKDKEIDREYELFRAKRFKDVFWPVVIYYVCLNLYGLVMFLL